MLGLRFCARAFSSCGKRGPLFIAVRGPLTIAASLVEENRLQTRRLSICGSRAQLLRGMWDLPRPGLEPVSPALAGRLSTTAPPGKPAAWFLSAASLPWSQRREHPLGTRELRGTQPLGLRSPPSVSPLELFLCLPRTALPMSMGPLDPRPGVFGAPPPSQHSQQPPPSFPVPFGPEDGHRVPWKEHWIEGPKAWFLTQLHHC